MSEEYWQERAEAAEQRAARMEAAIWKVFGHAHLSSSAMDNEVRRILTSALEQTPGALPIDRIRAVTSDVLKIHEGNVSTHYETCYLFHAGCLALLIHGLADDDKETEGNTDV